MSPWTESEDMSDESEDISPRTSQDMSEDGGPRTSMTSDCPSSVMPSRVHPVLAPSCYRVHGYTAASGVQTGPPAMGGYS